MDCSPMSSHVSVFASEEERIRNGFSHLPRSLQSARRHVAVSAKRKPVKLPIVRVAALQQSLNPLPSHTENSSPVSHRPCRLAPSRPIQSTPPNAAPHPACDRVARLRMRRPPDRRHLRKRKQKTHLAQRRLRRQALPEPLRKQQRKAPGLSHPQPLRGLKTPGAAAARCSPLPSCNTPSGRVINHLRRTKAPQSETISTRPFVPANLLHRRSRQHLPPYSVILSQRYRGS